MQSAAQKAMWARIKAAGGLQKLRARQRRKFGRISQYQTLFHVTPQENIMRIMKHGLIPKKGSGYSDRVPDAYGSKFKTNWLGSRDIANIMRTYFHESPIKKSKLWLIKTRVPKKQIREKLRWDQGSEYIVRGKITPKHFKWIRPFDRKTWKWMTENK